MTPDQVERFMTETRAKAKANWWDDFMVPFLAAYKEATGMVSTDHGLNPYQRCWRLLSCEVLVALSAIDLFFRETKARQYDSVDDFLAACSIAEFERSLIGVEKKPEIQYHLLLEKDDGRLRAAGRD